MMRYITYTILLVFSLSSQVFPNESGKTYFTGESVPLLAKDLQHIKLRYTGSPTGNGAKLLSSQKGKWSFVFDTPVELYVITRQKNNNSDDVSEKESKIGFSASLRHDFMLARGVFRIGGSEFGDYTNKTYIENYSLYNHQTQLTKESITDRSGIFHTKMTVETSRGIGFRGNFVRYFNEPHEDEKNVSSNYVFNQDIKLTIGEEYQIYRIYKGEGEFISISIIFKTP